MMDFLRRLAPPRDGDRSRAVAVLPSRFASELPLRSAPSESATSADDMPVSAAPRMANAPPERSSQSVATQAAPRRASDPITSAATARALAPLPERPTRARDPMQPARPIEATAKAEAHVAPMRRDADPMAEPPPHARATSPRPVPATARPLSPQAVAARTTPPEPPAPVIQVTIDHIEVRAPAAPARPPAPAKPRASTPSVSLADYLRGGRR